MPVTVSVLTAIHNEEKYLHEAIGSILNQSFSDFELIIINDASTDNSGTILQSYNDSRMRVINNPQNLGLTKSLNIGLGLAEGRYIARMDGDDISMPDRLREQAGFLDKHPDVGLVGSSVVQIDEAGNKIVDFRYETDMARLRRELYLNNQFCHGSVMFRKECIDKVHGYREEFRYAQDYDLYLRIAESYDVANLEGFFYKWRFDPSSISIDKKLSQDKYVELARECAKARSREKQEPLMSGIKLIGRTRQPTAKDRRVALACYYYNWGRALCGQGRMPEARIFLKRAAGITPDNLGISLFYLATFLPLAFLKKARAVIYSLKR